MNRIIRNTLALAILVLVALGGIGCSGNSNADEVRSGEGSAETQQESRGGDTEDGKPEEQAVPVEITELERGPIEAVLRYSTNLEAEEQVGVYSQSSRQVRALLVEEGDRVEKGQVLVRLEDQEQRTRLAKVKAQLDRARREYERQKRLFEQDLISEQDFNDATYELNQLELEVEDAERELSYTQVVAPITGTVTRRLVNLGDTVTMNQHLFDLVDFDSIVARVFVPEKELKRLERGQPARIVAPALGADRVYRGAIDRLSPVVDPQSGTVKVTVGIPRQEGLRPGMYVDVQLVTEVHEDAVLVPKRAVVYDDDQMFVYRVKDGGDEGHRQVERVYLRPLLEDERFVEPVEGVESGDRVVVAGQAGLKDGARVRLVSDTATGEALAVEEDAGDDLVEAAE